MSFSDLTRSYSTFPSRSQTATPLRISQPLAASTSAREGPSNIPGSSIAAGLTHAASPSVAPSHSNSHSSDLAVGLGIGLGLGISALVAVIVAVFVLKSRKAQRAQFERRAEAIRDTLESAKARPSLH
ncbi:hypothetical protein JCM11491_000101 [Sporobolomyces phaffii]